MLRSTIKALTPFRYICTWQKLWQKLWHSNFGNDGTIIFASYKYPQLPTVTPNLANLMPSAAREDPVAALGGLGLYPEPLCVLDIFIDPFGDR